jgi:hypothetical protein
MESRGRGQRRGQRGGQRGARGGARGDPSKMGVTWLRAAVDSHSC